AGIVGEGAFTPHFEALLRVALSPELAATLGFAASFATITAMFIVLADLVPKRLSMNEPERVAMMLVGPMLLLCRARRPLA
ncbi:CNNM domain-containing protein, partial [Klebsiella quasipneumoniae]|uniref:CNNM domain-containing protein n=1 Tax=Klebsiella quasipneumoniae TaxID=1463165 RepID=UPI00272FC83E